MKQTVALISPIQARGGGFSTLWKRAEVMVSCSSHLAILLASHGSETVAKAERSALDDEVIAHLSNGYLTQCDGLKGRGADESCGWCYV